LSRDRRRIVASERYQRLFPTRLAARHQAVPEFESTPQGCRIVTSVGGVLTGRVSISSSSTIRSSSRRRFRNRSFLRPKSR
jgi:hypothetical protein